MLNNKKIPKGVFIAWGLIGLLSVVFSVISLINIRVNYKDFSKVDFYLWLFIFGALSLALAIYIPRIKPLSK